MFNGTFYYRKALSKRIRAQMGFLLVRITHIFVISWLPFLWSLCIFQGSKNIFVCVYVYSVRTYMHVCLHMCMYLDLVMLLHCKKWHKIQLLTCFCSLQLFYKNKELTDTAAFLADINACHTYLFTANHIPSFLLMLFFNVTYMLLVYLWLHLFSKSPSLIFPHLV